MPVAPAPAAPPKKTGTVRKFLDKVLGKKQPKPSSKPQQPPAHIKKPDGPPRVAEDKKSRPKSPEGRSDGGLKDTRTEGGGQRQRDSQREQGMPENSRRSQGRSASPAVSQSSPVGSPVPGQSDGQRGGLATLDGMGMRYFDGSKPPPPPGTPPAFRHSTGRSPRISEEEAQAINKLSDYIEQLKAERELVESQIDSRRRELSDLADHTKQWQDQLVAQQQQGIAQQKQFNEYMTNAKSQYENYMTELYQQHKRAEDQKRSISQMHAKQNEENWRQIITQLMPEDTGSDSEDEDFSGLTDAQWKSTLSKKANRLPLSNTKITVKVVDGDESYSFAVASNFWDELLDQMSSVSGYSEHPLCHVGRESESPISINSSYLRFFASTWASQRENYCVSLWQYNSWKFIDAAEFWNLKTDTDPPPLEYVTATSPLPPPYEGYDDVSYNDDIL